MLFYHQLKSGISRTASIIAFVCLIAVSASAYTVVMRSGRRIEIPANFVVTRTTLTYEVSPGMQITLQMQAIDVAATERANNEQPGALLRRAQPSINVAAPVVSTDPTKAVRTITNRDLEAAMQRRQQSEIAYHQRVKQLGLPSLEESRRRAAAESEYLREELADTRLARNDSEQYWRSRASELRTELAAIDAEIEYISARIDEYPFPNGNSSITTVTTVDPYLYGDPGLGGRYGGYGRNRRDVFGNWQRDRRDVYSAPGANSQNRARGGFGRGRDRRSRSGWGRNGIGIGIGTTIGGFPNVVTADPAANYDYSYERSQLVTRFNELSAERAGLRARWRELEEEARRAGASPGWLRP
jgi:hypothetical protein